MKKTVRLSERSQVEVNVSAGLMAARGLIANACGHISNVLRNIGRSVVKVFLYNARLATGIAMNTQRIPVRIAKGLTLIRNEAARLDSARQHGDASEAGAALDTIRNECDHLRQYVGMLVERTGGRGG